ncbi:MAG: dipeptidyl aminopeptidase/acylaminoacyl peptidase [Paraglaciecola sp.]
MSINGVANVDDMMRIEKSQHSSEHWVVSYWQDVISQDDVKKDHLEVISPVNHVVKIQAPVLLIHGEYDEVVPLKQSKKMYREMKDAGKSVRFVELEKGDHYLSSAKNRMKAMKAIDEFVKKNI